MLEKKKIQEGIKRAISGRGLCIATSRCCLLRRCSCSSLESLCALQQSAQERDFVIEVLSGAVIRGTCRQVVIDRGKSRPLGSELPVASSLSALLQIQVTTLVGFERRAFMAVESRSRKCRRVVLRPRESMVLGSSEAREWLVLGSFGLGTTIDRRVGETALAVEEKARLNRKVCESERSHETAGVV